MLSSVDILSWSFDFSVYRYHHFVCSRIELVYIFRKKWNDSLNRLANFFLVNFTNDKPKFSEEMDEILKIILSQYGDSKTDHPKNVNSF